MILIPKAFCECSKKIELLFWREEHMQDITNHKFTRSSAEYS